MATLADRPDLHNFLTTENVATVAVAIDGEGTLHSASVVYWHSPSPLKFYFVTSKSSEKCKLLLDGYAQKAACVVGTYKGTPFTLQMRGNLKIVNKDDFSEEIAAYTHKRGDNHDIDQPDSVLLEFTPNWARFTDYAVGWDHEQLELT